MTTFVVRRVGLAAVQIFAVGSIVFLLVRLIPGDPARAVLGDDATDDQITAVRASMHLDDSVASQFFGFWWRLLQGDLGTSLVSGRAVVEDLPGRVGNSMELVFIAIAIALVVGIPLGRLAATHANRFFDHILTGGSVLGISLPVFVLGTLLLLLFGIVWPILPPARFATFAQDPVEHLQLLILPVLALAASSAAVIVRMTRSAMLETLGSDYVRTAKAKGLSNHLVIDKHALRPAMLPVLSVTSIELTTLIGSTVLIETLFGWPGMSSLLLNAVETRDYPVIQTVVLATAVIVILVNLATDLLVRVLDPRTEV
ncbi:ABC transporter permease [Mycolicibacterium goodii]|uniref:ABC transporter permease n=1 Tax=Mycolicibacterium goodii TaxID=134601 RepID=UPI000C25DAA6|nr:ABC transporter permease [Mycolicibacterium goodii]PJK18207.1 hypothetical protein CSX11_32315 [Mycolicibacterium goodii]